MRGFLIIVLLTWAWLEAPAQSVGALTAGDPAASAVLEHPCIVVTTTGQMALAYTGMARAFASPDLLGNIQREYAHQLPPGEQPEFVIQQTAPGSYHYVNQHGQESHIREVHRAERTGPATDLVLHTWGRRFFGRYEAVIHVCVFPVAEQQLGYRTVVHAYPENGVSRFLARHLGLVERYFRSKTAELETLSIRLGDALCAPEVLTRVTVSPSFHDAILVVPVLGRHI